jgi:UDP-GlcNAc3NAcA epimerase
MIRIAKDKNILSKSQDNEQYYFSTIHRPYNTDDFNRLMEIIRVFNALDNPVKFAVHPRTLNKLTQAGVDTAQFKNIHFLEPVSYFESLQLQYNAKAIITDSGGIQKEAYVLGKRCVTIRSETEWIETLVNGWNTLLFNELINLQKVLHTTSGFYEKDIYGGGFASNSIKEKIKKILEQ